MKKNMLAMLVLLCASFSAHAEWTHGLVNLTESWPDKIYVRWEGPNTQSCKDNDVFFDQKSLGTEAALERGFSLAMTAAVSEKPIRFFLKGCQGNLQKATLVQLCRQPDCKY